jgi:hypothetical protein
MLLSHLKESAGIRYIICQNSGDGADFEVVNDLTAVGEVLKQLEQGSFIDSLQVFEFKGEVLGMAFSGRGEIVFTTSGQNVSIFNYEDGEVYEDDRDLIEKFEIELD